MRIRGVQFSPALGDVGRNLAFHEKAAEKAANDGIDLLVFPELSLTGYQLQDIVYDTALTLASPAIDALRKMSQKVALIVGAPLEEEPGLISNCALCLKGGDILHIHRKTQLPNFGMFQEQMIFKPGSEFRPFVLNGFSIGLLICREILFPVHTYLYYLQGTDLLIGISNSPYRGIASEGLKSTVLWETMGQTISLFHHQHYLFVNRTGFEDGIGFAGNSFYASPGKGITRTAKFFEEDILDAEIDVSEVRRSRIASNYRRDEHPGNIFNELRRILDAHD